MHGLLWWINIVCLWYGHPTFAASGQTKIALHTSKNTGRMRQIIPAAFLEFSIGVVQLSLLTLWVRSKSYMPAYICT